MTHGMAVVDAFFSGYGELSDACDLHGFTPCQGPNETAILHNGNAYLDAAFPGLTRIFTARVLPSVPCSMSSDPPQRLGRLDPLLVVLCVMVSAVLLFVVSPMLIWWCGLTIRARRRRMAPPSTKRDTRVRMTDVAAAVAPGWELNDAARRAAEEQEVTATPTATERSIKP